eukprot:4558204-Pyramimonas_sp.AAC.1
MNLDDSIATFLSEHGGSRQASHAAMMQHAMLVDCGDVASRLAVRLLSAWSWGFLSANTVQWLAGGKFGFNWEGSWGVSGWIGFA